MSSAREELRIVNIHDRDFQKYSVDNRIYCVPVDDYEEERLHLQHELLLRVCDQKLFFPPIEYPLSVLDCGYGRGEWAVAMAENYEECEVTGIDIYPISLPDEPDNLDLFGYNLNDRLTEVCNRNSYDLVHSRFVAPGIKANRWPSYTRDMKALLKPNGWVQMMEYYPNIQSDNGRLSRQSALTKWWRKYAAAMEAMNRNPRIGTRLQDLMRDAGLRDVRGTALHLHIGDWDQDPVKASIGRDNAEQVRELLESLAVWPLPELPDWDITKVNALVDDARAEIRDRTLKLYITVYVAWGRRSSRG
ncbi:S-adenosyl-L-methionine-dependent methyltransferase [Aaosphaeria arxii CBS 175.79]|uniref:S-adenosyl-L-methionine-dependent methyltransferase n=1 Tax=Aaosphaeria arxii CBS 175.79 TaxID=1450172 RepID=A0A6A5Y1I2_9PLEO|nr:S-adenosyl-L-methionine-dependent methyltransferase [Aaosphaeria arxii CBS 175.79]KAF2019332.1 S-adenosyl-L-methionine-dependent methyltransferase [Aaosphaeria arxii CBS 175.79]